MRSLFIEAFVRAAIRSDLGIAPDCLRMVIEHIDTVLSRHGNAFSNPENFNQAYEGFLRFVDRMVKEAQVNDLRQLQERTFFGARKQCGIVWWCE